MKRNALTLAARPGTNELRRQAWLAAGWLGMCAASCAMVAAVAMWAPL
ncbi:hypothetical protein ACKI2N_031380 [Cupriavidus sp. 30B13]